ncbi:MAG: biliverdin-producing heme oxygenase [Gemmatimonadales bacterium]|nr:MAG: biliverdin-producing heme oxygenase [Gemmatimonadales bacterium]
MSSHIPDPRVMATLKTATAEHHHRAEKHEFQQMMVRGALSREAYAEWLGQMLLVHRGLEDHLARLVASHPAVGAVCDDNRRKVPFLLDDLAFYQAQADTEPVPATSQFLKDLDSVAASNPLALLGALYVLEGSTNGARFIARRLRTAYDLPADGGGAAYVDPYGDGQPRRWQEFKDEMEKLALTETDVRLITKAAQDTFDAIGAVGGDLLAHPRRVVPPTN